MPSAIPVIPTLQTAVSTDGAGKLYVCHDAPVPVLYQGRAIVKTAAVAGK